MMTPRDDPKSHQHFLADPCMTNSTQEHLAAHLDVTDDRRGAEASLPARCRRTNWGNVPHFSPSHGAVLPFVECETVL